MKKIHLIKFSFGTNVHQNIPIEQLEYFASFFSNYFSFEYSIEESQAISLKTIPITYKKISNNSDVLARKLIELLKNEFNLIDAEKKFQNNEDLVIVDIKSNLRDTSHLYLASEIDTILQFDTANLSPRFVIILEDIPALIKNYVSIEEYISNGKVLLIDKKKRFRTQNIPAKVNRDFSFELISKSSLDRTKFKLIRKIGHFGRYNDDAKNELVACNQFFYDGRDCVEDVSDVLFEKVISLMENDSFNTSKVIFDSTESPWLSDSILLLDSELKKLKDDYSLTYTGYKKIYDIIEASQETENILFVVDLIHTGTVFTKCYNTLREKFPNAKIKCVAILVSDTKNTYIELVNNKVAIVEVKEDEKISVDFFLSVNQKRYDRATPCIMCNELHMQIIKDSSYINEGVLTSFEVWTMCDEAGYGEEDFITKRESPYPDQVPLLPNRLELIKENSAYLALKYKRHIERNDLLESTDLILVFPDERTSKKELELRRKPIALEETASGYFAETLMQLKEIEYFGIPRNILDNIILKNDEVPDLTFIQEEHKDFYSKLRLLSDEIIVMDEFGLSGSTLKKIIAVLDIVKKKPKAYFPIFNFNPYILNNDKMKDYKVLSLYDFNLKVN